MTPSALLSDGTILLRPHRLDDCDAMYAAVIESIPEISPWLPWCHAGYSREETAGFIKLAGQAWAGNSHYQFAILAVTDAAFLGGIGIIHITRPNRLPNVGYWVRTSRTRQGIASAAVRLVSRYAFGTLGLSRLEIACIPTNASSRRVAEKVGAKFEAVARNRLVMHGAAYAAALYSLLPEDLEKST
ncbi:MAG: GNAT family N-acetyltransferase [Gammaproteobacteria bacterium]|nr:GNAT family N-acetyltransferase [Gammaproteobacteria bacterium]